MMLLKDPEQVWAVRETAKAFAVRGPWAEFGATRAAVFTHQVLRYPPETFVLALLKPGRFFSFEESVLGSCNLVQYSDFVKDGVEKEELRRMLLPAEELLADSMEVDLIWYLGGIAVLRDYQRLGLSYLLWSGALDFVIRQGRQCLIFDTTPEAGTMRFIQRIEAAAPDCIRYQNYSVNGHVETYVLSKRPPKIRAALVPARAKDVLDQRLDELNWINLQIPEG